MIDGIPHSRFPLTYHCATIDTACRTLIIDRRQNGNSAILTQEEEDILKPILVKILERCDSHYQAILQKQLEIHATFLTQKKESQTPRSKPVPIIFNPSLDVPSSR